MDEIKLPVRSDKDCAILDASGRVLVPSIIYRAEQDHLDRQQKIVAAIVEALNSKQGGKRGR